MDGLWKMAGLISSPAAAVFLHFAAAAAVFQIYCRAAQVDRPRDLMRHGLAPAWLAAPVCGWLSLQLAGGMLAGALGPGPVWLPYLWGLFGALAGGGMYYAALRFLCLEHTLLDGRQKSFLALILALCSGPVFFLYHLAQAGAVTELLKMA